MRDFLRVIAFCGMASVVAASATPSRAQDGQAGFLGTGLADVPPNGGNLRGAMVRVVQPGSPAEAAGLRPGDVVVSADGQPVATAAQLQQLVRSHHPADRISLGVVRLRGAEPTSSTLVVMLGAPPGSTAPPPAASREEAPKASAPSTPADQSAAPITIRWTRFSDPREHAFSLDVPAGWQVTGGLIRKGATDIRPLVRISSDQGIEFFLGDSEIGTFATPTRLMALSGFHEGSVYAPGGVAMVVMHYLPGLAFAEAYGNRKFRGGHLDARHDQTARVQELDRQEPGGAATTTAGDASFLLPDHRIGFVYAATQLLTAQSPDGVRVGTWTVPDLYGFVAPAPMVRQAAAMLRHMVGSVRIDPSWVRAQQGMTAQFVAATARAHEAAMAAIRSDYESKVQAMEGRQEMVSKALNGTDNFYDAQTGTTFYNVPDKPYVWEGAGGRLVGTDADVAPGVGFYKLEREK